MADEEIQRAASAAALGMLARTYPVTYPRRHHKPKKTITARGHHLKGPNFKILNKENKS